MFNTISDTEKENAVEGWLDRFYIERQLDPTQVLFLAELGYVDQVKQLVFFPGDNQDEIREAALKALISIKEYDWCEKYFQRFNGTYFKKPSIATKLRKTIAMRKLGMEEGLDLAGIPELEAYLKHCREEKIDPFTAFDMLPNRQADESGWRVVGAHLLNHVLERKRMTAKITFEQLSKVPLDHVKGWGWDFQYNRGKDWIENWFVLLKKYPQLFGLWATSQWNYIIDYTFDDKAHCARFREKAEFEKYDSVYVEMIKNNVLNNLGDAYGSWDKLDRILAQRGPFCDLLPETYKSILDEKESICLQLERALTNCGQGHWYDDRRRKINALKNKVHNMT